MHPLLRLYFFIAARVTSVALFVEIALTNGSNKDIKPKCSQRCNTRSKVNKCNVLYGCVSFRRRRELAEVTWMDNEYKDQAYPPLNMPNNLDQYM